MPRSASRSSDRRVAKTLDVAELRDVAEDAEHLGAGALELLHRLVQRLLLDVSEDELGARAREASRRGEPDPARTTRDHRGLPRHVHARLLRRGEHCRDQASLSSWR